MGCNEWPARHHGTEIFRGLVLEDPLQNAAVEDSIMGNQQGLVPRYLAQQIAYITVATRVPHGQHSAQAQPDSDSFEPAVEYVLRRGQLLKRVVPVVKRLEVES